MNSVVIGIFNNSKRAGEAVSEFVNKGFANDVTVLSKEDNGDTKIHEVKEDVSQGAATGATAGAVVGGLAALLAGAASFVLPGTGLVVLGPLATFLTGLGGGAAAGGLVGALVDWGIPDAQAKDLERRVLGGATLVGVTTDNVNESEAKGIFEEHGADEVQTIQTK